MVANLEISSALTTLGHLESFGPGEGKPGGGRGN
jgi:hypothetical protein